MVSAALPYVVGTVSIIAWEGTPMRGMPGSASMPALPIFIAACGLAAAALTEDPLLKMACFCVAGPGIFACLGVFWALPTAFLSGAACAGGIAVINSIGNLAGFAGPFVMGWVKDQTGSFTYGLLGAMTGVAMIAGRDRARPR